MSAAHFARIVPKLVLTLALTGFAGQLYAATTGTTLTVTARSGLRLRNGAGVDNAALTTLRTGTRLVATGRSRGGWQQVEAAGRIGWVKSDFVTEGGYCATCGAAAEPEETENGLLRAGRAIAKSIQDTGDAIFSGVLHYAKKLASFFWVGRQVGVNRCWRAVWNTLREAGLVSGELTQNSAKNAYKDLKKFGFRHDARACKTPGVVRVYGSRTDGLRKRSAGDTHGHVEIVGTDGSYNHFLRSRTAINERLGENRRPLLYCLIK